MLLPEPDTLTGCEADRIGWRSILVCRSVTCTMSSARRALILQPLGASRGVKQCWGPSPYAKREVGVYRISI